MNVIQIAKGEKFVSGVAPWTPLRNAISLNIPRNLPNRKIYLFLEILAGNTPTYIFTADVTLLNGDVPVCTMPAAIQQGGNLALPESIISMFTAGGSPVKDSLLVNFKTTAQGGSLSAVLQPREIIAQADKITLDITSIVNPTADMIAWHAFLVCISEDV